MSIPRGQAGPPSNLSSTCRRMMATMKGWPVKNLFPNPKWQGNVSNYSRDNSFKRSKLMTFPREWSPSHLSYPACLWMNRLTPRSMMFINHRVIRTILGSLRLNTSWWSMTSANRSNWATSWSNNITMIHSKKTNEIFLRSFLRLRISLSKRLLNLINYIRKLMTAIEFYKDWL